MAILRKTASQLARTAELVERQLDNHSKMLYPYCVVLSDRVHLLHAMRVNPLHPTRVDCMLSSIDNDNWTYMSLGIHDEIEFLG
jgi:hypothetical protein